MPALCDVNFLLALRYGKHFHHPHAKRYVDSAPAQGLVVCRFSQLALLRLLTNPIVMQSDVCTGQQSWDIYRKLMTDRRFTYSDEPVDLEAKLFALTASSQCTPKLWQDAYFAAFAIAAGLNIVTFDQGFRAFAGLAPTIPGTSSPS